MTSGNFDQDSLKIYFNRVVNLEKEKKAEIANFNEDIKAIYGEAKEAGFSPKILRAIVAEQLRPQRSEEDLDLERIYKDALGLTPLEEAAAKGERQEEAPASGAADKKAKGTKKPSAKPDQAAQMEALKQRALDKPGPKGAPPIPEALAVARGVVRKASNNRLDVKPAKDDAAVVTVVKSDTARGSVEKAMWSADEALIAEGFARVGGNRYSPPAADGPEA